jgi:hypothetical protein
MLLASANSDAKPTRFICERCYQGFVGWVRNSGQYVLGGAYILHFHSVAGTAYRGINPRSGKLSKPIPPESKILVADAVKSC